MSRPSEITTVATRRQSKDPSGPGGGEAEASIGDGAATAASMTLLFAFGLGADALLAEAAPDSDVFAAPPWSSWPSLSQAEDGAEQAASVENGDRSGGAVRSGDAGGSAAATGSSAAPAWDASASLAFTARPDWSGPDFDPAIEAAEATSLTFDSPPGFEGPSVAGSGAVPSGPRLESGAPDDASSSGTEPAATDEREGPTGDAEDAAAEPLDTSANRVDSPAAPESLSANGDAEADASNVGTEDDGPAAETGLDDAAQRPALAMRDQDASLDSVAENAAAGAQTGIDLNVEAFGDDTTFAISDDRFLIDDEGAVRVADGATFDAETEASISLVATALTPDGESASQRFDVSVEDVDEHAVSAIEDIDIDADAVSEAAVAGAAIGITVRAADADRDDDVMLTLSDDRFVIDDAGTVRIAEGAAFDAETDASIALRINAVSTDGSSSSRVFDIDVIDENEHRVGALEDRDMAADAVAEDAAPGAGVGLVLHAMDADRDDDVTFEVSDARFTVDEDGTVRVADGATFDAETDESLQLEATATSSDGSTTSRTFELRVADVDEAPTGLGVTPIAPLSFGDTATLSVRLAGEAYRGNPDYIVEVDGREVGRGTVDWARDTVAMGRYDRDGDLHTTDVADPDMEWRDVEFEIPLPPGGVGEVRVVFPRDAYRSGVGDRNLIVDGIALDGHQIMAQDADYHRTKGRVRSGQETLFWKGALEFDAAPLFEGAARGQMPDDVDLAAVAGVSGAAIGRVYAEDPEGGELRFETSDPRFDVIDGALHVVEGAALDASAEPRIPLQIFAIDAGGARTSQIIEIAVLPAHEDAEITLADDDAAPAVIGREAHAGDAVGLDLSTWVEGEEMPAEIALSDARFEIDDDGVVRLADGASFDAGEVVTLVATAEMPNGPTASRTFEVLMEGATAADPDGGSGPGGSDGEPAAAGSGWVAAFNDGPQPLLRLSDFDAPDGLVADETGGGRNGQVQSGGWTLVEDSAAFDIPSGALSITFRVDGPGKHGLFSRDSKNYDDGGHFTVWVENGEVVVRLQSDEASHFLTSDVTIGETTSVVVTFGAGGDGAPDGMRLYVDGELAASNDYQGGMLGNDEPIVVGGTQRRSGDGVADRVVDMIDGEVLSIELYDQPLTEDQAVALGSPGLQIRFADGGGVRETTEAAAGLDAHDPGSAPAALLQAGPGLDASNGFVLVEDASGKFEIRGDALWLREGETLDHEASASHALRIAAQGEDGELTVFDVDLPVLDVQGRQEGGEGDDVLVGSVENEVLVGGAGTDAISGGDGDDVLVGGDGADALSGGDGADVFVNEGALAGRDALDGGAGEDVWLGGGGDDVFWVDDGFANLTSIETIDGGEGRDVLRGTQDDDVLNLFLAPDLDGIEAVQGGAGDDRLVADDEGRNLEGGVGDDVLVGGAGDDMLDGGAGDDVFSGFEGADEVSGGEGDLDVLALAEGEDAGGRAWTLELDEGSEALSDEDGVVTLSEDASGEILFEDGSSLEFSEIEQISY